jgi:hypothetical protein
MPPERYSEGEHIRQELREAAKILPELGAYVSLTGRERHRLAPDKFTSKGRLLSSLRPKGLKTKALQHADGHARGYENQAELLQVVKDQPELRKYVKMSGKERGRQAPNVFSSHGRLLEAFRPSSFTLPPSVAPLPLVGANGRVYREATKVVDRAKLVETWQSLDSYTHEDVLKMYMFLTVDQRHELAPGIFNQAGKFRSDLKDLLCKPGSVQISSVWAPRGSRGISKPLGNFARDSPYPNDIYRSLVIVDGTRLRCSAWRFAEHPSCIVIAFTRASSAKLPPFGTPGMFRRAQLAAESFADLYMEREPTLMAIPRVAVSSRAKFFNESGDLFRSAATMKELVDVLDVAKPGRRVYLLGVGLDAFSTELSNYVTIAKKWPHLCITVVIMVHPSFAGSEENFQTASNGIRYAIMPIKVIALEIEGELTTPRTAEFVHLCEKVNRAKTE